MAGFTYGFSSGFNIGDGSVYVIVQEATHGVPTEAQIIQGQNGSGGAALWKENRDITTNAVDESFSITGLSAGQNYEYFAVWTNGAETSNVLPGSFTSAASTDVTGAISVTLDALVADLNGTATADSSGAISVTLDALVADLNGTATADSSGAINVTLDALAADLNGTFAAAGGAAGLKFGSLTASKSYIAGQEATKIYLGTTVLLDNSP